MWISLAVWYGVATHFVEDVNQLSTTGREGHCPPPPLQPNQFIFALTGKTTSCPWSWHTTAPVHVTKISPRERTLLLALFQNLWRLEDILVHLKLLYKIISGNTISSADFITHKINRTQNKQILSHVSPFNFKFVTMG